MTPAFMGVAIAMPREVLDSAVKRHSMHDPQSPIMIGHLHGDEAIVDRKMHLQRDNQMSLFDFM